MAKISGNAAEHFQDRGNIEVRVFLNMEGQSGKENAGKNQPALLTDSKIIGPKKIHVGRAVIVEAGSHIAFQITGKSVTAGIKTKVWSAKEPEIFNGPWRHSTVRGGSCTQWIDRYSSKTKSIKVSDWGTWSPADTFLRQDIHLSVKEVISFTLDGVHYPKAGLETSAAPGGVGEGTHSGTKFDGKGKNEKIGNEIGSMQMKFFVIKGGPAAMRAFYEELDGDLSKIDWG